MARFSNRPRAERRLSAAELRRADPELRFADVILNLSRREAVRAGAILRLSLLEFELLAFLLRHSDEGLTRLQLSEGVWGSPSTEGSNFVDVAIMGLRKKLEAGGRPRLVQTLRGYGYVLREGE